MLRISESDFAGLAKSHILSVINLLPRYHTHKPLPFSKHTADAYMDELIATHGPLSERLGEPSDNKKLSRPSKPSASNAKVPSPSKPSMPALNADLMSHVEVLPPPPDSSPLQQSSEDDNDNYSLKVVEGRARTVDDDRVDCKGHFFRLFRKYKLYTSLTVS